MNMTKEDNLKMSYDDFPKSRQKDNICLNTQTQKGKSNFKFKPHNSINMSSKVEPQPVDYRSRLSRAQSSKPLRVSLKDLDWVKKLKDKMTKKSKYLWLNFRLS